MFQAVTSYSMRTNRDAILTPRPRMHYDKVKEMVRTLNKRLGVAENDYITMSVFEGPSLPTHTEIVLTHRLGLSTYTATEISLVEALNAVDIHSMLISQSSTLTKAAKEITKDYEKLAGIIADEALLGEFDHISEKYFIQTEEMEQDYQNAINFSMMIRKKYCDFSDSTKAHKMTIVFTLFGGRENSEHHS